MVLMAYLSYMLAEVDSCVSEADLISIITKMVIKFIIMFVVVRGNPSSHNLNFETKDCLSLYV